MIDDDLRRCAKLLESLSRMAGLSARQLEVNLGYGAGTMHRIFNGRIELKMRHILLILGEVGVPASAFFREAFPEDGRTRNEPETAAHLLDLLERFVQRKPERPAPPVAVSEADLDERIAAALTRLGIVPQAGAAQAAPPAAAEARGKRR